ncbi:MAG TPA: winged helix-turn-helix domain-containing protein, partial [Arachidicoccus sp.]|nr:winged helix-turn-helix domain-containing protein [Arachidicoccus sp.]
MQFKIDLDSTVPVYKQLVAYVEDQIRNNKLSDGTFLPSMNVLSAELGISKETVKKAYSILREMEYIDASQGKGFYIKVKKNINDKVLVIFDKLSTYKLITYQSFKQTLGKSADINIILHEQDIKLFAQMVESNLELYDYFVI